MKQKPTPPELQPALGIVVTPRNTFSMLLRGAGGQADVVRRLTRSRARYASVQASAAAATLTPSGDGDAAGLDDLGTLHIGDTPGGADALFLASEFGDVSDIGAGAVGKASSPAGTPEAFTHELQDLLTECREGVGVDPVLALVMDTADVQYAEIRVPDLAGEKADKRHARMVALVQDVMADFDAERVVFLDMTPAEDGTPRYLAVAPRSEDASTRTLRELRGLHRGLPPARLLDTEVTLLIGMARLVEARLASRQVEEARGHGVTLVVRPGSDDTLVLALDRGRLQHYAQLRSLTAFDAPETLCSRILLQQDEHNVGDIARILVLSDSGEASLVEYLGMYYPDADVRSCREVLAVEMLSDAAQPTEVPFIMAYAAALRLVGSEHDRSLFPEVNLLPPSLLRRRVTLPFTWHTLALGVLLFATVFFFTARYVMQEQEIGTWETRVAAVVVSPASMKAASLQAEIDSLHYVTTTYTRSLQVIDSLLVGSDRWSRALEHVSQVATAVRGIWVESWSDGGTLITLRGNATSRDRIVRFADQIGGEIGSVTFAEIREFPVYSFVITVPLRIELPEAAQYLRDQVTAPDSLLAASPLVTPAP